MPNALFLLQYTCAARLPVRLPELADASASVQATTSRHEKVERLCAWLRRLAPPEVGIGVHYLSGRLRQGRIGVGASALAAARTAPRAAAPSLSLGEVDRAFAELARTVGAGSAAGRERLLTLLFGRATAREQDFLVRLVTGELRQGALEGLMLEAIACAAGVEAADVRRAAMVEGDLGAVAQSALQGGRAALDALALRLMQPLRPMLAQPAEDVDEALGRLSQAAFEYKLDGARVQLHKQGGQVRVFSRRLTDVTPSVPELVELAGRFSADTLVLDGEAIALTDSGGPLPFQETMRRFGRKQDVARLRAERPLSVFFFDCLYADGHNLMAEPLSARLQVLDAVVPPAQVVPRRVTADAGVARAFLAEALARGHEGLVAKSLAAPYEAGNRGGAWLKIKSVQTLDLVVLAAEWGNGRRRGWLSNLHLGARDPATDGYVMLGKTFKGMTDKMLQWQTERLLQLEVSRDRYTVYVRPALVVEIALNGLQASPQYPGGLALRFARVKRYREDKTPADADTIETLRQLHARQLGIAMSGGAEPEP